MNIFLRLKHWQLFILMFAIPIILQILLEVSIFSGAPVNPFWVLLILVMVLYLAPFFGWIYTLGTNLYEKLPPEAPMKLRKFKLFFWFPVVYLTLALCTICILPRFLNEGSSPIAPSNLIILILCFLVVHLFSIFCIFYCIYFLAKSLKAVELQRSITSSDYIGDFLLFWFFFIGIWFIQPRINKIFGEAGQL